MKEFMLLFRQPSYDYSKMGEAEMKQIAQNWKNWATNIYDKGRMSSNGMRLSMKGKVLKQDGIITDGPFVELREILGSFIIIKAENLEEAIGFAKGCPAIEQGGSVEVREVIG